MGGGGRGRGGGGGGEGGEGGEGGGWGGWGRGEERGVQKNGGKNNYVDKWRRAKGIVHNALFMKIFSKNAQKTDIWHNAVTAHQVCNAEYHNT